MTVISYLNFDLLIDRAGTDYRVQVLSSPAGLPATSFKVPFSDPELENFLLRIGGSRSSNRRMESAAETARELGDRLFTALFHDDLRSCLDKSLERAAGQGHGLRLRLHLTETPELLNLPWEYLYQRDNDRFLSLSIETPLVRYLDLTERIKPLEVSPPLHVLVMIASPGGYAQLDVEHEWANLHSALGDLEERGLITLHRLEKATLSNLQSRLRKREHHIFHFIGHGGFDETGQDGILLLEDTHGGGRPVSGRTLSTLLHDHRSLRLAVLNACEGAHTSHTDPFAGTAQSLVRQGIPAIVAMQFGISDEAAIILAREFYGALADNYPVDAALAEARKAIFAQDLGAEWGIPVLYQRAPDGRIFDIPATGPRFTPSPQPLPTPQLKPSPSTGVPARSDKLLQEAVHLMINSDETNRTAQYREAYSRLRQANQLDPANTEVLLHMAQCLMVLTPYDPSDEQRLLKRLIALVSTPRNDTERMQLAQANFLLATSREPADKGLLLSARQQFAQLGNSEWVGKCDELLAPRPALPLQPFEPAGQWQIQVTDGTIWMATFEPNGSFALVLQYSPYPMNVQVAGRWAYTPFNQMLQMQGLMNGFQPYLNTILIRGQQENGYLGVFPNGQGCLFTRTGP